MEILMIDMIMIIGSFTELPIFLVLLCMIGNYLISVLYSYQLVYSIAPFRLVDPSETNNMDGQFGGGLRLAGTDHSTHCDGHIASFI